MDWKKVCKIIGAGMVVCVSVYAFLIWEGLLFINEPVNNHYTVKGIAVSHAQGKIQWEKIKEDMKITFAFIKATEGKDQVDKDFRENWTRAKNSGVYVGAYHSFRFECSGKKQAKNFIAHVSATPNTLPPVVEVKYYGKYVQHPLKAEKVRKELDAFVVELENYYDEKPIIYTTMNCYEKYIDSYYNTYSLWICNTKYRPFLNTNRQWVFWQYSEDGKWPYGGKKGSKKVGMSVCYGNLEAFFRYFDLHE